MEQFYSRIPEINELIDKRITEIEYLGFNIDNTIELDYGTKFIFKNNAGTKVPVVVYFSKKNNKLSVVNEYKEDEKIRNKFDGILRHELNITDENFYRPFESWIGTDESGKGDYFGPLVTAGFYADLNILCELESYGIRDGKCYSPEGIHYVSSKLLQKFPDRIVVFELTPEKYNDILGNNPYAKNSLVLLAWCHVKVIQSLMMKHDAKGIIIDKFGVDSYITDRINNSPLKDKLSKLKVIQRIKAEENLAVAAASIIAREKYLRSLEHYSERYGFTIPRGAGEMVNETIKKISDIYGPDELKNIAKLHFSNTANITGEPTLK